MPLFSFPLLSTLDDTPDPHRDAEDDAPPPPEDELEPLPFDALRLSGPAPDDALEDTEAANAEHTPPPLPAPAPFPPVATPEPTIPAPPLAPVPPPASRRGLWVMALIAGVALLGYLLAPAADSQPFPVSASSGLFENAARATGTPTEVRRTTNAEAVAAHVAATFGQQIRPPALDDAMLLGVGAANLADLTVPVLLYELDNGDPLRVLVLSYALLDRHPQTLSVAPPVLNRIAETTHVESVGREHAVLWRDRDDLFLALTDTPDAVTQRLR